MPQTWTSHAIYYADLPHLIVEQIDPLRSVLDEAADHYHWVRHFAGGDHIRLHVRADEASHERIEREVYPAIRSFIEENPSTPRDDYDEERAIHMMLEDGYDPTKFDMSYHCNEVVPVEYDRDREVFASEASQVLLEDFRHDATELVVQLLKTSHNRTSMLLRLYLLHAAIVGAGDMAAGSVSFKSHWEGFRLAVSDNMLHALENVYEQQREQVSAMYDEIEEWYAMWRENPSADTVNPDLDPEIDAILQQWARVEHRYVQRAHRELGDGVRIFRPTDVDGWARQSEQLDEFEGDSEFIRLIADAEFGASMEQNLLFNVARLVTNLLYLVLPEVGARPIDKYNLCHLTSRIVEDRTNERLEDRVAAIVKQTKKMKRTAGKA